MKAKPLWDALILAGGASSRMKADKSRLVVGDRTLLTRTLDAASERAQAILVSADPRDVGEHEVTWSREDPVGAGPVAAIHTALEQVHQPWVLLLPCDLAHPAAAVAALENAFDASLHKSGPSIEALIAKDADANSESGKVQWLTALVSVSALRHASSELPSFDVPVRALFSNLRCEFIRPPSDLPAIWNDVDTPEDFDQLTKEFT